MAEDTELTAPQHLQQVYTALYGGCSATTEELAATTGLAKPVVERAIEKLIRLRLIEVANPGELKYSAATV